MTTDEQAADSALPLLQINPADNVAVALYALRAGQEAAFGQNSITIQQDVPLGAKLAICPIAEGEKVIKFGEPIGSSSVAIAAGEYVHTHNLQSDYLATADYPST